MHSQEPKIAADPKGVPLSVWNGSGSVVSEIQKMDSKASRMQWIVIVLSAMTLLISIAGISGFTLKSKSTPNEESAVTEQKKDSSLLYNQSTGELHLMLPDGARPHTCVWTIWGDHGSQMTVVTDSPFLTNQTNPSIAANKFLPPRVPIYVTCVDWENTTYQGKIGDY